MTPYALPASGLLLALSLSAPAQAPQPAQPANRPLDVREAADGTVHAEGPHYRAEFTAERIRMAVAGGASLELRYRGWSRGGARGEADPAAEPALAGDFMRRDHGDVVETYRVDARGFEQSFRIAERPAGRGDLVLHIDVAGTVAGAATAAGHRALVFDHEGRGAIRYGSAVAFGRDRQNEVDVLTSYDGHGRIELTVPAAFVDRADYPILVDPVVGPVVVPLGSGSGDNSPEVAHDRITDRYLVVRQQGSTGAIAATLLDGDGNVLQAAAGIGLINLGVPVRNPAVTYCRGLEAFLVTWARGDKILVRLVSPLTGTPISGQLTISDPQPGESDDNPTVCGMGDGSAVVAWDRTFAGDTEPRGIRSREIRWPSPSQPSSIVLSPERDIRTVTAGFVEQPRLSDSDYVLQFFGVPWSEHRLVWTRFWTTPAPGDYDIETCSFEVRENPFQFAFVQSPTAVPGGNQIGVDETFGDIGGNATAWFLPAGQRYLIAWQDQGDIRAHLYDRMGPVGSQINVRGTSQWEVTPVVGAGYCEFTVAYGEASTSGTFQHEIHAARVLYDGTVAIDHREVLGTPDAALGSLAISSRPNHDPGVPQSNTTQIVWADSGIHIQRFEPVAPSMLPFGNACAGPGGTLPTIGTTGHAVAGSQSFAMTVTNAPAATLCALVVSDVFTTTPIPGTGCELYAGLPFITVFPTVTDGLGDAEVPLPLPCSIPTGTAVAFQWAVYTPGWNPLDWIVSDDLDVAWNH